MQPSGPAGAEPEPPSLGSSARRGGRQSPGLGWQRHGPGSAVPRRGRVGSGDHIQGRAGAAGPGSVGHEATGPPSPGSAFDSGHSDGPDLELGCPTGSRKCLVTSARGAPSPGSGVTPGRAQKGVGAGLGPWPGGPGSDVPASVLPLPGDCGAGDEAFSSSCWGCSWGYFCGCSACFRPHSGSPPMSEKTAAVKRPLPPWQSSGL